MAGSEATLGKTLGHRARQPLCHSVSQQPSLMSLNMLYQLHLSQQSQLISSTTRIGLTALMTPTLSLSATQKSQPISISINLSYASRLIPAHL